MRNRWRTAVLVVVAVLVATALLARRHQAASERPREESAPLRPVGTSGGGHARPAGNRDPAADLPALRSRHLLVPIEGSDVERWKGSFEETHSGHKHEAVDILAPRNTPIHAVDDGRIAKLFESKAGGLTIYQIDASQRFIYYYAHLDHYADVRNGDAVSRGQVIGYVGTSGNAPPGTPHLHFTIFRVTDPHRWWEGTAIDPYLVYTENEP